MINDELKKLKTLISLYTESAEVLTKKSTRQMWILNIICIFLVLLSVFCSKNGFFKLEESFGACFLAGVACGLSFYIRSARSYLPFTLKYTYLDIEMLKSRIKELEVPDES